MRTNRVIIQPWDINHAPLSKAAREVSFDQGATFRSIEGEEQAVGVVVQPDKRFTVRASFEHYWPVRQELIVKSTQDTSEPILELAGPKDYGSNLVARTGHRDPHVFEHVYVPWMALFRDGTPARLGNGNTPPPPYAHTVLAFDGPDALSAAGKGYGRLAAHFRPDVPSYGPSSQLVFAQTVDDSVPQLAAILVPDGLNLLTSVPVHVFFCPSTGRKKAPYPFSNGAGGCNEVFHNYLSGGNKRLLSQHQASNARCVFVFPLPPPAGYFSGIHSAKRLRRYCLEVVYFLQRLAGNPMPVPWLGRCALSAFSEGGAALSNVLASSPGGSDFPELKELYLLDVVAPCGNTSTVGSYQALLNGLTEWYQRAPDRHVRIYTQYSAFNACAPTQIKTHPTRANSGASEANLGRTTFLYAPMPFWATVAGEQDGLMPNPAYALPAPDSSAKEQERAIHQLMPCVFLEHALRNSAFAKG